MKNLILPFIFTAVIFLSGCGNHELTKDSEGIADIICRSKGVTEQLTLEATKPMPDPDKIAQLQAESEKIQKEMNASYQVFNKKYAGKITDKKFNKEFEKELSKALMNCKNLSEEDKKMLKENLEEKN